MSDTVRSTALDTRRSGFQRFEPAAARGPLTCAYNSQGDRLVIASPDHRLRVYHEASGTSRILLDQWRAHDAEIFDVQWVDCILGQFLASIGGDNKFKLWREKSSQETRGRRFKCIFSQSPPDNVSYAAFGSLVRGDNTFFALVSQNGLLTFQAPTAPTSLASWREIDALYPFGQRSRSDEPRFSISFHHAAGPPSQTLLAGLDPNVLSIAVSCTNAVKVFRTMESGDESLQLREMLEIPHDTISINSISWAPGCSNPLEIIAVASDDGFVRLFEIHLRKMYPEILPNKKQGTRGTARRDSNNNCAVLASGSSEGLADGNDSREARKVLRGFHIKHEAKEIARLIAHTDETPMTQLQWSIDGSTLVAACGSDDSVHMWRQSVYGDWIEFARCGPTWPSL